jgi:hypothetical protein
MSFLLTEEFIVCDDNIAAEDRLTYEVIGSSRTITNFFERAVLFPKSLLLAGNVFQRMRADRRDNTA